jgi:hypothetical protein
MQHQASWRGLEQLGFGYSDWLFAWYVLKRLTETCRAMLQS